MDTNRTEEATVRVN